MKTMVIANPHAAAGRVARRWVQINGQICAALGRTRVRFTSRPGEATELTRAAIRDGADRIVVVGGDGTTNEAVNGFMDEGGEKTINKDVTLVVFPYGTGGDFPRSIGLSDIALEEAVATASVRLIDLGRATFAGHDGREMRRHFVNISSFGSSGLIVDKVNRSPKHLGAKASFIIGAARGMLSYQNQPVHLKVDDQFDEELVINTVAVANGRYFGGSMNIAPQAQLDDGQFDVVTLGDISVGKVLLNSHRVYAGTHLTLPDVHLMRGRTVEARPLAHKPVLIDLDGEQPGALPARYEIIPKAIKLLAPWNRADAGQAA